MYGFTYSGSRIIFVLMILMLEGSKTAQMVEFVIMDLKHFFFHYYNCSMQKVKIENQLTIGLIFFI